MPCSVGLPTVERSLELRVSKVFSIRSSSLEPKVEGFSGFRDGLSKSDKCSQQNKSAFSIKKKKKGSRVGYRCQRIMVRKAGTDTTKSLQL